MKVLFTSKPHAMMSLAFSTAKRWQSSSVRSFHRYFSSSVNWTTRGMSNTSCSHLGVVQKCTCKKNKKKHDRALLCSLTDKVTYNDFLGGDN